MSHTQLRPTPQLLANLAAKRKAAAPVPVRTVKGKGPHVTQSNEYDHTFVSPLTLESSTVEDEQPTCDLSWMPTADEVGRRASGAPPSSTGWTRRRRWTPRSSSVSTSSPRSLLRRPAQCTY